MPLYTYYCPQGHRHNLFSKIEDRDAPRKCEHCASDLERLFEAPSIRPDIEPYISPASGKFISSQSERRDDLKRSGCIEWEPGIRQDAPRLRQEADDKAFAPMEASLEQTARELISSGKLDPL